MTSEQPTAETPLHHAMPPALDDEEKDGVVAVAGPLLDAKAKAPAPVHEMTLDLIRSICRQRQDLYDSAELNDKLFLNFGGFKQIKVNSKQTSEMQQGGGARQRGRRAILTPVRSLLSSLGAPVRALVSCSCRTWNIFLI